jgi:catechol 2,3-dioxygenase-like lactoylglutathione lyase family enzyme
MLNDAPVFVTIGVKNIEKAKEFYGETLGLKLKPGMEDDAVYEAGGGTGVALYETADNAGTNKATYATWEVQDLEDVMNGLRDKGVAFEDYDFPGLKTENGVASWENQKAAWFKDLDGNILCLHQNG